MNLTHLGNCLKYKSPIAVTERGRPRETIAARAAAVWPSRWRVNRFEVAGAFGDMGTSLPLLLGILLASKADTASVLTVFGLIQIFCALVYGIPMPAQPLKAVAAVVIAQDIAAPIMFGAGFSIGLVMLVLTATGLLTWLARLIPDPVVRGVQFGLGLTLASVALRYLASEAMSGYVLACASLAAAFALRKNRVVPRVLVIVALGLIYAFACQRVSFPTLARGWGFALPQPHLPSFPEIIQGFLLLGLVQIPLSLGNSLLATEQLARDLFPERRITLRKIGWTYSLMNLTVPFLSGVPVCHGSGGLAGMHACGGRTGAAPLLYGVFFLCLGLWFSSGFATIVHIFPLPMLGVLLLIESVALMQRVSCSANMKGWVPLAVAVGVCAFLLPYGFLIGMAAGTIIGQVLGCRGQTTNPVKGGSTAETAAEAPRG